MDRELPGSGFLFLSGCGSSVGGAARVAQIFVFTNVVTSRSEHEF